MARGTLPDGGLGAGLGRSVQPQSYASEASRVRESFRAKFWNAERGCLYDVLADSGPVAKFRPNQIFAVSLRHGLLDYAQETRRG